MGAICQEHEFSQLVGGTVATTVIGVLAGVRIFRVHDVKINRQAADVTNAIKNERT
jgi:dihydropteroate synthase